MSHFDRNDYFEMLMADLIGILTCLMGWRFIKNHATKDSLGSGLFVCAVVALVIISVLTSLLFVALLLPFIVFISSFFSDRNLERKVSKNINKKKFRICIRKSTRREKK